MSHEERPPIRLDQFLKQQGAVGTGGHAKVVIQAGEVTVNGVVETRRRKQLAPGDVVAYAGEQWRVEVTQESQSSHFATANAEKSSDENNADHQFQVFGGGCSPPGVKQIIQPAINPEFHKRFPRSWPATN